MKRIMIDPSTKPDRQLRITDMHAAFNADWLLSARGLPMTSVAARRSGILDRLRLSRHGSGTWQAIHDRLRGDLRELLGGRLSKDFEAHPQTSEAWIRIAMIQLMTRHLAALAT